LFPDKTESLDTGVSAPECRYEARGGSRKASCSFGGKPGEARGSRIPVLLKWCAITTEKKSAVRDGQSRREKGKGVFSTRRA